MENLEKSIKSLISRHPIISTIVAVKAIDLTLFAGSYFIWPEETLRIAGCVYDIAKNNLPIASACVAMWPKEIFNACETFSAKYYKI